MTKPVHIDDDDRTRVTFQSARPPQAEGEDCLVIIHATLQADFGRRYELKNAITTIGRGRDNAGDHSFEFDVAVAHARRSRDSAMRKASGSLTGKSTPSRA